MKRTASLAVVAALLAGTVLAQEVPSVNAVGFARLNIVSNFNMMSYNWSEIGTGTSVSVQDLFDTTQLRQGGSFGTSDNILLWDRTNQAYKLLYLYDAAPSYPSWDGKWLDGSLIATNVIKIGEAAWYQRRGATTMTWSQTKPYSYPN